MSIEIPHGPLTGRFALTAVLLLAGCAPAATPPSPRLSVCPGVEDGRVAVLVGAGQTEAELRAALVGSGAGEVAESAVFVTGGSARVEIRNVKEVERLLSRSYPPRLRDRGVTGIAYVLMKVDTAGRVQSAHVGHGTGHPELDAASLAVARGMLFHPLVHDGCRLPVWAGMPVQWNVPRTLPPGGPNRRRGV